MSDYIWEMDIDLNITYISERVYNVLGYKPEELIGKPIMALVHPEEGNKVWETIGDKI